MAKPQRLLLLAVPAALVAAWFALGLDQMVSWRSLAAHRSDLQVWAAVAPMHAAVSYVGIYAAMVALSLPVGALMTMVGGLLFGAVYGAALAVVAATLGATLLFVLARGVLAPLMRRRAGPMLAGLRQGLQTDGFNYLLAMRLIPVVPFWLSNLAPALAGMRLLPYVAATAIGIVPVTAVLAGLGAGVGDVLAAGGAPDLSVLRAPQILLPLLGLAAVSLLPVAWRRRRVSRP